MPYFSHMGIAIFDSKPNGSKEWQFHHKLRLTRDDFTQRSKSGIFIESVRQFFMDTPFNYDFTIIVLDKPLEERMFADLSYPHIELAHTLSSAKYNELADPFTGEEQNSNTWILYQLIAGISEREKTFEQGIPYIQR